MAKRYFFVVVGGFIASAAYFQARGISQIVAANTTSELPPADPRGLTTRAGGELDRPRSVDPLLEHNVFDSETGPLIGFSEPTALPPVRSSEGGLPACDGVQVRMIVSTDNAAYSFAALGGPRDEPTLRRIGDDVDGWQLEEIRWDRVVMAQAGSRCQQVLLTEDNTKSAANTPAKRTTRPPTNSKYAISDDVKDKIQQVGPNQFKVDRSAVDDLLAEQAKLMGSAKLRNHRNGGMQVAALRSGSLLSVFGLKRGDVLESINGFALDDPEKALEAYSRLRTAGSLNIQYRRGGSTENIAIDIQ